METNVKTTKITVNDLELWTAPFGQNKAIISAREEGMKIFLLKLHEKLPEDFELLVDDADFCEEDMEGTFSVIVDPEIVHLEVFAGSGKIGFVVNKPDCDEDCENCKIKNNCAEAADDGEETEEANG